jgi:hypothetical protein
MVATAGVTASPAATATVIDHVHALLVPAMGFSFRAGSPVQTLQVPGRSMAVGIALACRVADADDRRAIAAAE